MSDAVNKYKGFHGKDTANIVNFEIDIPDEMIFIGKAYAINYKSDKWDGVSRYYEHKLKQHGDILISPDGKTIVITNLNLQIKPEGLTG
jgi:hypothetical protein